ncbi:DAK2 domain-containing protein [Clostridium rectalis]|uniref:DAK2 domain-containing protein n=1 Tax=Clostridium rectalis TaxID=2040295 RepID=UPI000F635CCD|nr:DAK2 domain-containing protein [Clostridium rectalis]
MEYLNIDGQQFYNMVVNASNRLEDQKEYVNALNVFPVPDGDTGTNMSMTFKSAVTEIKNLKGEGVGVIAKSLAKGALMGARGNSGVILSQILRGISKGFENKEIVESKEFANSILEGAKAAYKAVMRPTEGTILTIIKSAGEAAVKSDARDIRKLMEEICNYSDYMLQKTPEMLPVLKQAKVVDAGGAGLLIILQGMYEVLERGIKSVEICDNVGESTVNSVAKNIGSQDIKFGYCTEFFILSGDVDIEKFKFELEPLGDSMIVVGSDDLVKVHIHTNDPGFILSKAVRLGQLSKVKIDNMREQHRHILEDEFSNKEELKQNLDREEEVKKYGFVSVSLGEGIKNIFKDLGVDYVIEGGQTMNPSTEDILNAVKNINAENIFILPNNKNIIMAASQAAELSDKNLYVIPTKTIPQGITAITSFNPNGEVEDNINFMSESITNVVTGSVTYAVRETEIDGKEIKEGDIMGLKDGKIAEVGKNVFDVCKSLLSNMVNEDSELITIFYGKDCEEKEVENFISELEDQYDELDIQCYSGEQPLYYFIFSVE